jgi:hypothetical protein
MWFVPPDVGVTVIVVFIDGDPAQGYWIGCVPSRFANNMVPAIAGSAEVDYDKTDKTRFNNGSNPLPVAEINRKINSSDLKVDPDKIKKPLHPIAEKFLEQGLVADFVRGTTTSSARREVPSMVFGISTPGELGQKSIILESLEIFQSMYIAPKQDIIASTFNQLLKFNGSTTKLTLNKYELDVEKINEGE